MGAARGARRAYGRDVRFRTSPAAPCSRPRADGDRPVPPRDERIEELPAKLGIEPMRSRTSSASCSPRSALRLRRSRAAFASSRARAHEARSSSSPTRSSRSCAPASRRSRSQWCCRASSAGAVRSRRCSARSAFRSRSKEPSHSAAPRSATRSSACSASPRSAERGETCSRSCARRTPVSPGRAPITSTAASRACGQGAGPRVEEESAKLLGHPLPVLGDLRSAPTLVQGARNLARTMLRVAYGLESPPVHERARLDLRAHEAAVKLLDELEGWSAQEEVQAGRAHRRARARAGSPARNARAWARCRARPHARTHAASTRCSSSGSRKASSPPRSRDAVPVGRDRARAGGAGRRLARPDARRRDRYLFYTACTRPWAARARARVPTTGRPREPSPFYEDAVALRGRRGGARHAATSARESHLGRRQGADRARTAARRRHACVR